MVLFDLNQRFTQSGFDFIRCPKFVVLLGLSARWSWPLRPPGALRTYCPPHVSGGLQSPEAWSSFACMGFTASVSRQAHFPSLNNVLSVESVQIFMFVLNDEERKVYKNFKLK